jgi:hypothetical protein
MIMNEARELLKIAREMVAGVSVGIGGFNPLDMSEILFHHVMGPVAKAMGSDWHPQKADYDGGTRPSGFTGTLNIYIDNDDQMAKVLQALKGVFRDLDEKGVKLAIKKDTSRMTEGDVLRIIVRANPEAKYEKMGQTEVHMTETTWGQILDAAGLNVSSQAGDLPLRQVQKALEQAETDDSKVSRFMNVVINIAKIGQKLGYKSMSWG